jgi:hypothetical protein
MTVPLTNSCPCAHPPCMECGVRVTCTLALLGLSLLGHSCMECGRLLCPQPGPGGGLQLCKRTRMTCSPAVAIHAEHAHGFCWCERGACPMVWLFMHITAATTNPTRWWMVAAWGALPMLHGVEGAPCPCVCAGTMTPHIPCTQLPIQLRQQPHHSAAPSMPQSLHPCRTTN